MKQKIHIFTITLYSFTLFVYLIKSKKKSWRSTNAYQIQFPRILYFFLFSTFFSHWAMKDVMSMAISYWQACRDQRGIWIRNYWCKWWINKGTAFLWLGTNRNFYSHLQISLCLHMHQTILSAKRCQLEKTVIYELFVSCGGSIAQSNKGKTQNALMVFGYSFLHFWV